MSRTCFSVNLNKVALLRNSRGNNTPDLVSVAERCLRRGVHGITVHPRPDQRHARYDDVPRLAELVARFPGTELNVEGNPIEEFVELVERAGPHQVTLVPDAANQLTSDHGWDAVVEEQRLRPIVARLRAAGMRVSLFLDPVEEQVFAAKRVGADRIELYTEPYARAFGTDAEGDVVRSFANAAAAAVRLGLGVNAGHDLNQVNLASFLERVPDVLEVSIGHAVICEALDEGLAATLDRYLGIVRA